jgi:eukaryotic-like serine/threonine-protein kinase
MDPARLESIFNAAAAKADPAARSEYLDQACGDDRQLRQQVEALLLAHEDPANLLRLPDVDRTMDTSSALSEGPGSRIGAYKLLEEIGEGGFAVVFMAEQEHPVRRRIALKIIKPGMDTRQVVARFEAERQALAMMDHPNIARVFDAGSTGTGRPFFVMELVKGVPITEYCDQNHLDIPRRLELFAQVCQAIRHAHAKGLIHRDIKPSNVLVSTHDEKPLAKVIDFGIAKATQMPLTEKTVFTSFGQLIGTPAYMSPEQAAGGLDVDTRSDVYSLGVLLYELLAGSPPYDLQELRGKAFDEMQRIIREVEPPTPSARLATTTDTLPGVAARRATEPKKLGALLRGELDWIVMKALEKDRNRRYETAEGFARDIDNFLSHQPVEACPPSAVYRLRKFARRNRVVLLTAGLVAGALVAGTAVSIWQAVRAIRAEGLAQDRLESASRAREDAERNFQRARQAVDDYFTLVSQSTLFEVPGLQPLRKELLESAVRYYQMLAKERGDDPGVLAELVVSNFRLAQVLYEVAKHDDAVAAMNAGLDAAEQLDREHPGALEKHLKTAGFWNGDRRVRIRTTPPRDWMAASNTLQRFARLWERFVREDPAVTSFRSDLGNIYQKLGDLLMPYDTDQATLFNGKAVAIWEQLSREQPGDPRFRDALAECCEWYHVKSAHLGKPDDEAMCSRVIALREQLIAEHPGVPKYHQGLVRNLGDLAARLANGGRLEEAVAAHRRQVDLEKDLLRDFPGVPEYCGLLIHSAGQLLKLAQKPGPHQVEAEKITRESMSLLTKLVAENRGEPEFQGRDWRLDRAVNCRELSELLVAAGQRQAAEEARRQGIDLLEKLVADFPDAPLPRSDLAKAYKALGEARSAAWQGKEAQEAFRQAAEQFSKASEAQPQVEWYRASVGHCFRSLAFNMSDTDQAREKETAFRKAIEVFEKLTKEFPQDLEHREYWASTCVWLGRLLQANRRFDEARDPYRQAIEICESAAGDSSKLPEKLKRNLLDSRLGLVKLAIAQGQPEKAEETIRKAISEVEELKVGASADPAEREKLARVVRDLAEAISGLGRRAEAEMTFHKALSIFEKLAAEFSAKDGYRLETARIWWQLGNLAAGAERFDEAEESHRRALAIAEDLKAEATTVASYRQSLAMTLLSIGDRKARGGQLADAEKSVRSALQIFSDLTLASPDTRQFWAFLAESQQQLARLQTAAGRPADAEKTLRQALESYEKVAARFPQFSEGEKIALVHLSLGELLAGGNRAEEADQNYRKAIDAKPNDARVLNGLAWFLATASDARFRDARRAVEMATRAVELAPQARAIWNTLGVSRYRAGEWAAAGEALGKSMELSQGGDGFDWFFLAMVHKQLDRAADAREWYDKAVEWMEKNAPKDQELLRFRAEAAALLGINKT